MAGGGDKTGYKVEELTPQPPAYSTSSRHGPRRSLLQKEGNSNVSYRGIERKPLKYLKVGNRHLPLKYLSKDNRRLPLKYLKVGSRHLPLKYLSMGSRHYLSSTSVWVADITSQVPQYG